MKKFITPRTSRIITGLVVASAFAVAPVAAQADTSNATGTLTAGTLSESAPAFTAFSAALTGATQTVGATTGAWTINDAVGDAAAYHVTAAAGVPTVGGTAFTAAELATMSTGYVTLTSANAVTHATGNPAPNTTAPVAIAGAVGLLPAATSIYSAAAATGAGAWNVAADTTGHSLGVIIPGDAPAGAYVDVLTYTIAAGV